MVLTVCGSVVFCLLVWTAGQVMDLYGGNTTMRAARSGQQSENSRDMCLFLVRRMEHLTGTACRSRYNNLNSNSLIHMKLELVYHDYTWQWRLCPISSL